MTNDEPPTAMSDRDASRETSPPARAGAKNGTAILVDPALEPGAQFPGPALAQEPTVPPRPLDNSPAPSEPASVPVQDPLVGTVIADRYRLLARVGEGGMGAVYRGEHVTLGKRVAVKFLHAELSRVPEVVARFEREARAAAQLEHVNVVAAHDFGKTAEGQFFLVMEFVDGKSLRDLLSEEGRLPPARALHIARHIASALKRAHALGIVHRDLKPENVVLVEREGDKDFAKVIDFGIAKDASGRLAPGGAALTQAGMVFGTPDYMAPEQALGANVDHRADIYAFGVMVFEMLTGRRPFEADDVMSLLGKHMTAPPPAASMTAPPGTLPPSVDAVLARMLAKSPGERFSSAIEAIQALESALGVTPAGHYGTPPLGITAPAPQPIGTTPHAALPSAPSIQFGTAQSIPALASVNVPAALSPRDVAPAGAASIPARPSVLGTVITGYRELRRDRTRHRIVVAGLGVIALVAVVAGIALRPKAPAPVSRATPTPVVPMALARRARPEPSVESPPAPERPTTVVTPSPSRPTPPVPVGSGSEAPLTLPPALAAQLAEYRARPQVAQLLSQARGRRLRTVIATFEQTRAQAPDDPILLYLLGTLYARERRSMGTALERYAAALRVEPGFARDATLLRDVVRAATAAPRAPEQALTLLSGPLAPSAVGALLDQALDGRGAARARAAALLETSPFRERLDATARGLLALERAGTCEERLSAVQLLGREGDRRALPYLRRVRVGPGCGFFGLGICNPCLTDALPAAINAIERRSR